MPGGRTCAASLRETSQRMVSAGHSNQRNGRSPCCPDRVRDALEVGLGNGAVEQDQDLIGQFASTLALLIQRTIDALTQCALVRLHDGVHRTERDFFLEARMDQRAAAEIGRARSLAEMIEERFDALSLR